MKEGKPYKSSPNQLANLRTGTFKDDKEVAKRAQQASVEARKRNKIEREIQKEIAHTRMTMCDEIYQIIQENGGLQEVTLSAIHNCIENGQNRDLLKLLELIKPAEKQDIKISGNVGVANTIINVIPVKGMKDGNKS